MQLNEILNIKYPIIQGGMANISDGKFAAAVSNAGGLGIIASGGLTPEGLCEEINIARKNTKNPFGVNVMLLHPQAAEIAQVVADEKIAVVTTGAGNPERYVEMWKLQGAKVIPVIPSVALGKRMQRAGVDAIIAEGTESGGHVGELTTMALVPQVVSAVDIPVIAAGGIASGRQMLASFALGAIGVQVGTCLLASVECPIHENYKQAIIKANDTGTVVTGRSVGVPVRVIKNQMARKYLQLEKEIADKMELEELTLGSLRRAVYDGDVINGSLMAGQVCGQIDEVRPIYDILKEMYDEYMQLREAL